MCNRCMPQALAPRGETAATAAEAASKDFADRMVGMLNAGALSLMISLGHRTGLFDVMKDLPPASAQAIADAAGLQERYVREWLGAMVAGGIVSYEPGAGRYRLPGAHAAWLCRQSPMDNLAVFAQYIPQLGAVEDRVLECFRAGGGVPYAAYGRFHDIMEEDSGQSILAALEEHILPLAPGLEQRLHAGIRVLDVGCGRGRVLNELARLFPRSELVGYDLSEEAVAYARAWAQRHGQRNVRFEVRDLTGFDRWAEAEAFDLVTAFDAIHDQGDPAGVLRGIARSLRPDGVLLMQDIAASSDVAGNVDHPLGALLYTVSCMHCMTVSLAQGGAGLGAMWGEERALDMLAEAGFGEVEVRRLAHDVQNSYYLARLG